MIYLVDHEDSFTFNLAHLLGEFEDIHVSNYYNIDKTKIGDFTVNDDGEIIFEENIRNMKLYESFDDWEDDVGLDNDNTKIVVIMFNTTD